MAEELTELNEEPLEDYSATVDDESEGLQDTSSMEADAGDSGEPAEQHEPVEEQQPAAWDAREWFSAQPEEAQGIISQLYEQSQRLQAIEQARQPQQRTLADLNEQEVDQYLQDKWANEVMPTYYDILEKDVAKADWYKTQQIQDAIQTRQQHGQLRAQRNQYMLDQRAQQVAAAINHHQQYEPIRWAAPGIVQRARQKGWDPAELAEEFRLYEEAKAQQAGHRREVQNTRKARAYGEQVDGGAPPSKGDNKPTDQDLKKMWQSMIQ
jgi:uncharacterized protein YaiI (UPF0178 family)